MSPESSSAPQALQLDEDGVCAKCRGELRLGAEGRCEKCQTTTVYQNYRLCPACAKAAGKCAMCGVEERTYFVMLTGHDSIPCFLAYLREKGVRIEGKPTFYVRCTAAMLDEIKSRPEVTDVNG